jgi:hypothetical protein
MLDRLRMPEGSNMPDESDMPKESICHIDQISLMDLYAR